jgi:hypothetical protein
MTISKSSAAGFLDIPRKPNTSPKQDGRHLKKWAAESKEKRWNRKPGERVSFTMMKAGSFARMDCGCLIVIVNYTKKRDGSVRPLLVVENDQCNVMASWTDCRMMGGDKDVPGIWRKRTPGYKAHIIGSTFYDIGQEATVVDKEETLARWREELKNEC